MPGEQATLIGPTVKVHVARRSVGVALVAGNAAGNIRLAVHLTAVDAYIYGVHLSKYVMPPPPVSRVVRVSGLGVNPNIASGSGRVREKHLDRNHRTRVHRANHIIS